VVAVSLIVTLVSITQARDLAEFDVLQTTGTHLMAFIPQSLTSGFETLGISVGPFIQGTYTVTFNESVVEAIGALPGVRDAAPYLLFRDGAYTIGGADFTNPATNASACARQNLVSGRYLTVNDTNEVMLEQTFASAKNLEVNDTVIAFNRALRVVGIVNTGIAPAKADIYANIQYVQGISHEYLKLYASSYKLSGPGDVNVILVEVADSRLATSVFNAVQELLSTLASRINARASIASYACWQPAANVMGISSQFAWGISFLVMLFVTLFALKSQLGSVVERTREIGVLKAVGWANSDVVSQITVESVIQGLIGGAIGCAIGYTLIFLSPSLGLASNLNLMLQVAPSIAATGLAISLMGGVAAGILPARRAVHLNPTAALRHI
jgi:putative ABC transport system permease protein